MLEVHVLNWTELFVKIINHSFTVAVLTGLVSIIVVKMQKNNKKQEIDYLNEAEIKKEVRKLATEIVTNVNEIAVAMNTYIDMIDKSIDIINGREVGNKTSKQAATEINTVNKEKINQINKNSNEIATNLVRFELYFADSRYEHDVIEKARELQHLTVEFKMALFEIQQNFTEEKFVETKRKLIKLSTELNESIPEFSVLVRKSLRLYLYKLHGKPRLTDRIRYLTPRWVMMIRDTVPISVTSFFIGLVAGLLIGLVSWIAVG